MNSERYIVVKGPDGNDVRITQDMLQNALDQLLEPKDTAKAMGISRQRLGQLRKGGAIAPFVTIGKNDEGLYWDNDLARLSQVRSKFPQSGRGQQTCWRADRPTDLT